ncbi:unnamed protein product, partial [Nesidiocoris tenuis]
MPRSRRTSTITDAPSGRAGIYFQRTFRPLYSMACQFSRFAPTASAKSQSTGDSQDRCLSAALLSRYQCPYQARANFGWDQYFF